MKIKKGDNVIVISGKDKGKKGKILKVIRDDEKVVVEGINVVKRRQRPRKQGEKGQTVDVIMPLHVSNIMLVDPKGGKRTRIGKKLVKDAWVRIAKKSGTEIK
ncbi:50S ribosomal protein L24 [bacterium]|nr:50S ribosomal protein L24 [bacterium]|tara:strand:+ start:10920 stop:11228 length:309 start_codon:yes stop_codon:yes gene_type:complete